MKLREYIKKLREIEKEYGRDLDVIYSIDDEGNAFHRVNYLPTIGYFSRNSFNGDTNKEINSVCVN